MEKILRVMTHTAGEMIDDRFQERQAVLDLQQLVDLLLVLDHGETAFRMRQHVLHLVGDGILIDRYRHAAHGLGRRHGPVQMGPVVADDGQPVAPLESQRRQATGECADLVGDLGPCPSLPDPVIFFAACGFAPPDARVRGQQFGKSV